MDGRASAALIGGVTLLERAVGYTLGSLQLITPQRLARPTPCQGWTLSQLLRHMQGSLDALLEAVELGHVALDPALPDVSADPVAALRERACQLVGAWTSGRAAEVISIGGCPITASITATAGALEIAVHGWDVGRACGKDRPIPEALAEELLRLSPMFVTAADRPVRFAAPVPVAGSATTSDQLVSFLGRRPAYG
ncbi:MAG: TIGR03086 family metal-binding protein [Micromonosporaceae bacterium]